jgi:hypothetical protein
MARKETAIEDALFQIKNLEEALNRNAQGILSSTMKEEISSLVKESLKEQDEVDTETETEVDVDNEDETGAEEQDTEMVDTELEDDEMMEPPVEPEDDTIDLTQASDEEVLKVFKAMGDNDGVIVKKDNNMLHLSDTENNTDYLIQLGESEEEMMEFDDMDFDDEEEMDFDDEDMDFDGMSFEDDDEMGFDDEDEFTEGEAIPTIEPEFQSTMQETIYELELDDDMGGNRKKVSFGRESEMMEFDEMSFEDDELESEMMEMYDEFDDMEMDFEDEDEMDFEDEDEMYESWMNESKKTTKAKGMGMGNASKFKYGKTTDYPTHKQKEAFGGGKVKAMGTGKPKFEYKEEVNYDGFGKHPKKQVKKMETKEASRTLGNGKRWGRKGLDKPKAAPRHLRVESSKELELMRAKNEEYRKALDLFRTKLNEVAIFNSNLAYATRLFTEHSTTKQEKINILRRFDNVDTLKESKNLYRVIKSELGTEGPSASPINESVQRTVEKTPSTGSAVNLIESKTYENPQFLRMKDLMTKIK